MFLIRAFVVLLVVVVSLVLCEGAGGESKNDRMDDLFSLMYDMGKRVNSLSDSVQKIYRMEEETAEHMLKTEDRVAEIAQNEEDMSKKIGSLDTQMAQVKTQIGQLETKVDNVDDYVVLSWLPWKFIGHGYQGSYSHDVHKYHTTLQECIAFCTKKRQDSGAAWNGFYWYAPNGQCGCKENETGHTEDSRFLHFKF